MADLTNIGGGLYLPDMAALYKEGRQKKADDQNLAQAQYNMGRQQVTDQRGDALYANTQAVAAQAANGDAAGAKKAALAAGNFATLDHLDSIDDHERTQAAEDAEFVGRLVPALGQIDGSDNGAARREAARPYLKQRGLTDDQINQHDFSDHGLQVASSAAMSIKDRLAQQREDREANKPITAADGAVLTRNQDGSYSTVYTPGTKPLTQVVTDPVSGAVRVVNVPGTPGQSTSQSGPSLNRGNVGSGGFQAIDGGFVAPHEGGYADRDGASGAPVNFGINQKFNPDVDVKSLTADQAQQLRKTRYWDGSGAANQPTPAGQAIVYDTAMSMGPQTAQRMVKETGGDPAKMLTWRDQRYRSIATDPAKAPFLNNWLKRNADLAQFVQGQGNQPAAAPASNGPTITDLGNSSGPVWKDDTRNGVLGQTNTRTGEFKALPGQKAQDANSLQSGEDAIDQSLSSLDRLAKHPGLSAAVGSGFDPHSWLSFNPLSGKPLAGSNAADFTTQLDTFKSQQFLSQVAKMKGLGALSDAEGAKLSAAAGNLATNQSETQFMANVKIIRDGLVLAKQRIEGQKAQHARVGQAPTSAAANPQVSSGLPAGSQQIGTSKKTGRPVYRLPNGQTVLG